MINISASALVEIDVQNDFCPGGALAVNGGDEVIGPLNKLACLFAQKGAAVITTQDWHPENHVSFAASHTGKKAGDTVDLPTVKGQTLWPNHCVQGSEGAAFHKDLDLNPINLIIRKGFRQELDSYSAFYENDRTTATGLEAYLKGLSIDTVFIGGLATDYCVFYSTRDAQRAGFTTYVIRDAVRGVEITQGSVERALKELVSLGVNLINSEELN